MKASEAPEKIYMNWVNYPLEEIQVEYTRTDAFVDKAAKWIEHNFGKYDSNSSFEKEMFIEEFIKAMKL